ncbi:phosphodiester glycosidase family protein [Flavobacterium sp. RNTU_13]|uniref:phosphodiester glycosidase family protein n=1 Tax=Flavobacterium sp. RNTU_13 TaxID=3375145 RepID=UPI00398640A7
MKFLKQYKLLPIILLISVILYSFTSGLDHSNDKFISYTANPETENIILYYKDNSGKRIGTLGNLKTHISKKGKKLLFGMNGGMFQEDFSPVGLYIENGKTIRKLNTRNAGGNFYMKPNGVFYITKNGKATVCKTEDFRPSPTVQYATQSGPMLVIKGTLHPDFKEGSTNLNIRNGVGILPDGKVLFAMSKTEVNFYEFAKFFKDKGCKNALYLDGFVSRAYAPSENWQQIDGNFGMMIGVSEK